MNRHYEVVRTFLSLCLVVFSLNTLAQNNSYDNSNSAKNNALS
jgi:hypothetical protein